MIEIPSHIEKSTTLGGLLKANKAKAASNGLSAAQTQLADQISLSSGSQKALEGLRNLDKQLSRFLDVLKGKQSAKSVIAQINSESNSGNGFTAVFGEKSALSLSQIKAVRDTTALTTEINDQGTLDVILSQTRDTLSQTTFSLSTQKNSFFARR